MIVFFDTETCGVPANYRAPLSDASNWPRMVQLGWLGWIEPGEDGLLPPDVHCSLVKPDGWTVPEAATAVHGISQEDCERDGRPLVDILSDFVEVAGRADLLVGHNIEFDLAIVGAELCRLGLEIVADSLLAIPRYCTMRSGTDLCKLPGRYGYKWPRLNELYRELFGREPTMSHRADADVQATAECYFEMKRRGIA